MAPVGLPEGRLGSSGVAWGSPGGRLGSSRLAWVAWESSGVKIVVIIAVIIVVIIVIKQLIVTA